MNIKKIILLTNHIEETYLFYKETLGFEIIEKSENFFSMKCGISIISFKGSVVIKDPFYHFAFDIPYGSFKKAKEWLGKRVILSKEDKETEIFFEIFNSNSIYFEDPSGNIVEFIERKDNLKLVGEFDAKSVQKISEMSLVVQDKMKVTKELSKLNIYSFDDTVISPININFMTDNKSNVFIILVNKDRKWLFSDKGSKIFEQKIVLDSGLELGIDTTNTFYYK